MQFTRWSTTPTSSKSASTPRSPEDRDETLVVLRRRGADEVQRRIREAFVAHHRWVSALKDRYDIQLGAYTTRLLEARAASPPVLGRSASSPLVAKRRASEEREAEGEGEEAEAPTVAFTTPVPTTTTTLGTTVLVIASTADAKGAA